MTREEAIAIIENEKECVNRANKNDYCNRDCYNCELVKTDTEILTALDMAIESLEQEPCEDAISRQAVLDGLGSIAKVKAKSDAQKALMGRVMFFTEQLPPVTPQPKMGHWIIEVWNNKEHHTCSNCQHVVTYEPCYHYCPYCGAEMIKPQESEGKE